MTAFFDFLMTLWHGAPVIIWFFVIVAVALLISWVAFVVLRVRKLHIHWKSKKREFTFDTENGGGSASK